jgi:hypothetical protein
MNLTRLQLLDALIRERLSLGRTPFSRPARHRSGDPVDRLSSEPCKSPAQVEWNPAHRPRPVPLLHSWPTQGNCNLQQNHRHVIASSIVANTGSDLAFALRRFLLFRDCHSVRYLRGDETELFGIREGTV